MTKDIYQFAARVGKKFGVEIEFVETLDGERRGEITGNKIKIARDATQGDVVKSVIMHELMHKAEGSGKLYDKLQKMILDLKYGGDQDAMNADIAQKVADYSAYYRAKNRTDAFTEENAKEEIVADYMGEILNGNPQMIERLVRDDYTLAQKIRNIIHDVIDKFTGVKDPQIDQMKKAVRMLDKAIRTADKSGVVDTRTRNQLSNGLCTVDDKASASIQYSFEYLTKQEDMPVVSMPPLGKYAVGKSVDRKAVKKDGIDSARANISPVSTENKLFVENRYTQTPLQITKDAIEHGMLGSGDRLKRNANAASIIGYVAQNAIPVNELLMTERDKANGTIAEYLYIGLAEDAQNYYPIAMVVKETGEKLGDVVKVHQFDGINKRYAYSLNASEQQKRTGYGGMATNSSGTPIGSTISIADLLALVKDEFGDGLSEDVLTNLGIQRPTGKSPAGRDYTFAGRTKYSLPSRSALEADILAWQKAHQAEIDAAKKKGDSRSQQPDTLRRNPLPDPVKRVIDDNAIFCIYKADTNEAQFNRAMEKIEENGYAKEVKRLLDADDFTLDDSVEAGALAIAAFARVIRLWGIERQKCSNELTKTMSRSIIIHRGTLCPVRPLPAGFSAPSGAGI